ncbi:hypothetical protein OG410_39170 [Streptomyces sp. NBC_00659]|uniref:hypothetical protein n=1 Tax=Streptomyces sp. NBC_00659 TaxID=2903669 RepID=UPI002E30292A|nr:hypothetical protein [Streptomyces sp. NBC_00659]
MDSSSRAWSHCWSFASLIKGAGVQQGSSATIEDRELFEELMGSIKQDWRTAETAGSTRERRRLLEPRADEGVTW